MNEKQSWFKKMTKQEIGDLKTSLAPKSRRSITMPNSSYMHPYMRMEFPVLEKVTGILPEEKQVEFRKMMKR